MLARDVAYDLIPFAQRRGLHARLAEALESTLPRAAAATIAFHYSKSCHSVEGSEWKRAVKAIQYWEVAAEEAMDGIDHGQVSCSQQWGAVLCQLCHVVFVGSAAPAPPADNVVLCSADCAMIVFLCRLLAFCSSRPCCAVLCQCEITILVSPSCVYMDILNKLVPSALH